MPQFTRLLADQVITQRYRLIDTITSDTFRAWDNTLERIVFVTVIDANTTAAHELNKLSERVHKLAKIQHTNILTVYDVCRLRTGRSTDQWTWCIVTEAPQHALQGLTDDQVSWPMLLKRFVAVAAGIQALHQHGIQLGAKAFSRHAICRDETRGARIFLPLFISTADAESTTDSDWQQFAYHALDALRAHQHNINFLRQHRHQRQQIEALLQAILENKITPTFDTIATSLAQSAEQSLKRERRNRRFFAFCTMAATLSCIGFCGELRRPSTASSTRKQARMCERTADQQSMYWLVTTLPALLPALGPLGPPGMTMVQLTTQRNLELRNATVEVCQQRTAIQVSCLNSRNDDLAEFIRALTTTSTTAITAQWYTFDRIRSASECAQTSHHARQANEDNVSVRGSKHPESALTLARANPPARQPIFIPLQTVYAQAVRTHLHHALWAVRNGHIGSGTATLHWLRDRMAHIAPLLHAEVQFAIAQTAEFLSPTAGALAELQATITSALAAEHYPVLARALAKRAVLVCLEYGDRTQGRELLDYAYIALEHAQHPPFATIDVWLAHAIVNPEPSGKALHYLNAARRLAERTGDPELFRIWHEIGNFHMANENFASSLAAHAKALEGLAQWGDRPALLMGYRAQWLNAVTATGQLGGSTDNDTRELALVDALLPTQSPQRAILHAMHGYAWARQGNLARALHHTERAVQLTSTEPQRNNMLYVELRLLHVDLVSHRRPERAFQMVRALCTQLEYERHIGPGLFSSCYQGLSTAALPAGRFAVARWAAQKEREALSANGIVGGPRIGRSHFIESQALIAMGKSTEALQLLRSAKNELSEKENPEEMIAVLMYLAALSPSWDDATANIARVRAIITPMQKPWADAQIRQIESHWGRKAR